MDFSNLLRGKIKMLKADTYFLGFFVIKTKGGIMPEKRLEQLKAERENLNMRIAEINFLIQGYEAAEKAAKKEDQKESKK